jgi:hypothetical protein
MEPIVIDDFIPELYQKSIFDLLTGQEFPWTFHNYSVSEYPIEDFYTSEKTKEHIQLRHVFVNDGIIMSNFFQFIVPLAGEFQKHTGIPNLNIQRIKSNLLIPQEGIKLQPPHTDGVYEETASNSCINRKTLLYYVNDADGDTIFYDKHFTGVYLGKVEPIMRVSPKRGRAVIFDSNHVHSGTCPTEDYRMVVNCVFY